MKTEARLSHLQPVIRAETRDAATDFVRQLAALQRLCTEIAAAVVPSLAPRAAALSEKVNAFEVRTSLVGQVKAGKTALANGLIGKAGMLPSDVNPWTAVVTSVHLNTPKPDNRRAVFSFFTREEWDSMVVKGGRLGEIAQRADFDEESAEVHAQCKALQLAAEKRLGANFNLLLGGSHSFSGFSPDLIKRYVCLGETDAEREGRYADVTRSAHLYTDNHALLLPMVIRDTPGVNDPFLVREAVTLENLGDTDICVIVLNANQAFATVDVALLRILQTMRQDQVIIYVNRIDELEDPGAAIAEIDARIRETLADQDLPTGLPIIFGSAVWAQIASFETLGENLDQSEEALDALIAARKGQRRATTSAVGSAARNTGKTNDFSGLGDLQTIVLDRAIAAVGHPFLEAAYAEAQDLCDQASLSLRHQTDGGPTLRTDLDAEGLIKRAKERQQSLSRSLASTIADRAHDMRDNMTADFAAFVAAESDVLQNIVGAGAHPEDWQPQTLSLQQTLNARYRNFSIAAQADVQAVFDQAAGALADVYRAIFADADQVFRIRPPQASAAPVPTMLMQSSSIDVTAGWIGKLFLRRTDTAKVQRRFAALVTQERDATLSEMEDVYVADFAARAAAQLQDFMLSHVNRLSDLMIADGRLTATQIQHALGVDREAHDRLDRLETLLNELSVLKAGPQTTERAA